MHDERSDYIMHLRDKIHRHIRYTNAIVDKFFFLNIQVFAFANVIITSIAFWISFFILQLLFYRKSRYAPSETPFSIFRWKELINHFSSVIIYIFVDTTITIIISNFQQFPKFLFPKEIEIGEFDWPTFRAARKTTG